MPLSDESVTQELEQTISSLIDENPTFGDLLLPQEKQFLLDHGKIRSSQEGDVLCEQNHLDTRVFILVIGELEVSHGEGEERKVLAHLRRGDLFGEISALFKMPRVSNVITKKPSVLLEIPGEILEKIVFARNDLLDAVLTMYKQRVTETAIRSVPLFGYLDHELIDTLVEQSSLMSIPSAGQLVKEGEPGEHFYVVVHGVAKVTHEKAGIDADLALLRTGDYFGEWSLLTGAPRSASVTALSRVDAVAIDCKTFLELIKVNPGMHRQLDKLAYERANSLQDNLLHPGNKDKTRTVIAEIEDLFNNR